MPLRCWIGLWTTFFLLLVVAFDLSALVRYITRFTEESFACLIAIIFIYEAFKKQFHIVDHYGINPNPDIPISHECDCYPPGYKPSVDNMASANITNVTAATTIMTSGLVLNIDSGIPCMHVYVCFLIQSIFNSLYFFIFHRENRISISIFCNFM